MSSPNVERHFTRVVGCGSPRLGSGRWLALFPAQDTEQGTGVLPKAEASGMFSREVGVREGFGEEAGILRDGEELECFPGARVCHSWDRAGSGV